MEQYCLYLRKSRADIELEAKGELETLARHEKILLDLSKKMKLNITKIYKEVVSGETIDARPVVQHLIEEVENGQWTGVVVMEVERLARGDTIDQGIISRAFKLSNTKIITPIKTYDPANEFDEEYFEFGLFMSRREYKTITRRIQRGRIQSAKDGKFISSTPPFGYDKVKILDDKGYTLKPNEDANIVKIIYDLYINGYRNESGELEHVGTDRIASILDKMALKPTVSKKWSKSSIRDILKNPVYMGKLRWSYKKEIKTVENGKMIKKRSKCDNCILVDALHEAIITEEQFNKAQKILKQNTRSRTKKDLSLKNPLSGLIFCKKCGRLMTRLGPNSHNPYDVIKCPNKDCDNISAPIYMVEKALIDYLQDYVAQHKLDMETEDNEVVNNSMIETKKNALENLKQELDKVHKQIQNTYDLVEQGIYTIDVFTSRNQTLTKRANEIQDSIHDLEKRIKEEETLHANIVSFIPAIENALDCYYKLDSAQEKNDILKNILLRVDYEKNVRNTRGKLEVYNFDLTVYPILPKTL